MSWMRGSSISADSRALVDEGDDAGSALAVVGLAVVASAVPGPDRLELVDDLVDAVGQQAGELQKPEVVKERLLLLGQSRLGHDTSAVRRCVPHRPFMIKPAAYHVNQHVETSVATGATRVLGIRVYS